MVQDGFSVFSILWGQAMSFEKNVGRWMAWLQEREAVFENRRGATGFGGARRDRIKTELAELQAIREAFEQIVVAPLPPMERAMFGARVDAGRRRIAVIEGRDPDSVPPQPTIHI